MVDSTKIDPCPENDTLQSYTRVPWTTSSFVQPKKRPQDRQHCGRCALSRVGSDRICFFSQADVHSPIMQEHKSLTNIGDSLPVGSPRIRPFTQTYQHRPKHVRPHPRLCTPTKGSRKTRRRHHRRLDKFRRGGHRVQRRPEEPQ